jgi:hypothetical protein
MGSFGWDSVHDTRAGSARYTGEGAGARGEARPGFGEARVDGRA